jgi:Asp/Glu/hydantoin racemase
MPPMRLLVVNSNTTDAVTARIEAEARAAAAPGTVVEAVTAPFGLPLIVTRADWQVAGTATLAALGARAGHYDAAIIACFGDLGRVAEEAAPLIDGTAAAVSLAEAMVRLSPRLPRQRPRAPVGLDAALAAFFRDDAAPR